MTKRNFSLFFEVITTLLSRRISIVMLFIRLGYIFRKVVLLNRYRSRGLVSKEKGEH